MKLLLNLISLLLTCYFSNAQLSQNALRFDGNDDVVKVPSGFYDVMDGDFTIEAFIRNEATETGYSREIILNDVAPVNSYGIDVSIIWGSIVVTIGGNSYGFPSAGNLRDSACHHIAISRTSGFITSYIDGQTGVTQYAPDSLEYGNHLWIGGAPSSPGNSFKGLIKEVRFWNTGRTGLQILNNMNSTTPSGTGLVGYWRLNEGTGNIAYDHSPMINHGVLGEPFYPSTIPVFSTGCTSCIPSPHILAGGPVTFCNGGSVLLSTRQGAGYSYQWKINGSNLAQGSSMLNAVSTGSYTVEAYNSCGSGISNIIQVKSNTLPGAGVTAAGPATFCSGSNLVLNAVSAPNRAYQWQRNGINIPGALAPMLTVTSSGSYKVTVTNIATGCTKKTPSGTQVTVNSLPSVSAAAQGSTTFCAGDSVELKTNFNSIYSYQWKKNNTNISGANKYKYYAKTAGNYKVRVTNNNTGCTKMSGVITVSVPCRENGYAFGDDEFQASGYPNPSAGNFVIEIEGNEFEDITAVIIDVTGRIVKTAVPASNGKLIISGLAPGVYTALISNGKIIKSIRLVKTD